MFIEVLLCTLRGQLWGVLFKAVLTLCFAWVIDLLGLRSFCSDCARRLRGDRIEPLPAHPWPLCRCRSPDFSVSCGRAPLSSSFRTADRRRRNPDPGGKRNRD